MKIVVDTLGGDNGAKAAVSGAITALAQKDDFSVILVGNEQEINGYLFQIGDYPKDRVQVVNATQVITCEEAPVEAIRKKKDSSLVIAYKYLKEDQDVGALVTCGSTGAVLAGGIFKLGRMQGIIRPALAPLMPTITDGQTMLIDSGANVDCKSANLVQFAVMGSAYMKNVVGIENPRVALLCNGTEDQKGCELTKEVFALLKQRQDINFVGNMEARDMVSGKYDVIVADGFDGNIALKGVECGAKTVTTLLKSGIKSSFRAKIGYLFLKPVLKNLKQKLDFNKIGGAVLMGLEKIVVKGHGASDAECISKCILQARRAVQTGVVEAVKKGISEEIK